MAKNMNLIPVARVIGLVLGLIMVVYLSTFDGVWEADNPFLVPDILMGALLLASVVAPRRWVVQVMVFAYGWTAGILAVTVGEYIIRGEFAYLNLVMAVTAAGFAVLLTRCTGRTSITPAAGAA